MNKNKIQSYDDLIEERKRLEALLIVDKEKIANNWAELKHELAPINNAIGFLGKFTSRDKSNPLINLGVTLAGDLLLRRFLLARAGWATRVVVPFLVKNVSSNILADKGKSLFQRIKHWLKTDKNGQPHTSHKERKN